MIDALYILILMLPLPVLLNRWRGTGTIVTIGKFRLIGNIIYALYIAGIVGCAYALTFGGWISVGYGLLGGLLYILGESFAWGKWVGHLTDYDGVGKPDYDNDDGRSFPYIHYIAQAIVKQENDYTRYCEVALTIRGLFWWLPLLVLLGTIDLISWYQVAFSSIFLAVGFPVACYLGTLLKVEYKSKYLNMSRGWENQELVYGLFHWIGINLALMIKFI